MRMGTIVLAVLISLGLCSCANTMQVKIGVQEHPGAEQGSIIFVDETIMAPEHYPGVPGLYKPVLDDCYLLGELWLRYNTLRYEERITEEIKIEYKNKCSEIQSRGNLPYPVDSLGITAGYALVDLDGDGTLELLVLDTRSYQQEPVMAAIFAIRNGQVVCIDDGSLQLNNTILAADGTFYQYTNWGEAGYTDLTAYRLEPGMSEFTLVSEAHAALSFSEGDIPVPFWIEIENGIEVAITEDAFITLFDQYKNPAKPMVLDFVPLHPDAVDPWSIPRDTDEAPVIPVEYPVAYEGAPQAYQTILDALFLLGEYRRQGEYGPEEYWELVGFAESPYPRDSSFGYALIDLNNDGILELLLGTVDGLGDSAPNSIFTLKDGQPHLLTSFVSRNYGVISADATIYNVGSGGAAYTYLSSYRVGDSSEPLIHLTDMRSNYAVAEGMPYYYQVIEGRNYYISEKDFHEYLDKYQNVPDRMKLIVYPIS